MNEEKIDNVEIFLRFLDQDAFDFELRDIFEFDNFVYAFSNYMGIRFNKKFIDFEVKESEISEYKKKAITLNFFKKFNSRKEKILQIDEIDFLKYKTIDEEIEVDNEKECEECDGHGEVTWTYGKYKEMFNCPVCSGDGILGKRWKEKTGLKCFGNTLVKFGDFYLRLELFYCVILFSKFSNNERILLKENFDGENYLLFKVGHFEILIMRYYLKESENSQEVIIEIPLIEGKV